MQNLIKKKKKFRQVLMDTLYIQTNKDKHFWQTFGMNINRSTLSFCVFFKYLAVIFYSSANGLNS